jgi:adenylyltransferase and sulfurtransferase
MFPSHVVASDIPLAELVANPRLYLSDASAETYFICKLGNDSQLAVDAFRSVAKEGVVKDLVGGLRAWANEVDPNFPIY